MFTITLLSIAVLLLAQTVPASFVARKVAVGSYKFKLEERDGKCDLVYEGPHNGTITLDMPPPCEFLRDRRTGKAQNYRYWNRKDRGFFLVILVIGGPLDTRKSHVLMPDGCATQTQAISLSSRGVISGDVGRDITVCPLDGLDEVSFALSGKPV